MFDIGDKIDDKIDKLRQVYCAESHWKLFKKSRFTDGQKQQNNSNNISNSGSNSVIVNVNVNQQSSNVSTLHGAMDINFNHHKVIHPLMRRNSFYCGMNQKTLVQMQITTTLIMAMWIQMQIL